jgi:DNA polymerase III subunit epsilon
VIALDGGACGQTPRRPLTFVAIDFETADRDPDSACAVAAVRVVGTRIVTRVRYLIRPPRRHFIFSDIHDITWADVADSPSFHELWPSLRQDLDGVDFLAAHNASFDQSVLTACCARARIRPPRAPFRCTVAMARSVWSIYPTTLPDVCRRLGITLHHHDPLSDAEACARIVIASAKCARCSVARNCFPARAIGCQRSSGGPWAEHEPDEQSL